MELSNLMIDAELAAKGVPLVLSEADGSEIRLARFNNPDYRRSLAAAEKRTFKTTESERERLVAGCWFGTIILGWSNLTLDAEPFEFTRENVTAIMIEEKWAPLRRHILDFCMDDDNFRAVIEGTKANLEHGGTGEDDSTPIPPLQAISTSN